MPSIVSFFGAVILGVIACVLVIATLANIRSTLAAWILIICFYGISCYGCYKQIQLSHYHPKGVFTERYKRYNMKPGAWQTVIVFIPVFNTCFAMGVITQLWREWDWPETDFFTPQHPKP